MEVKINNRTHEIPFDPASITLDQYIDYYNMYGKDLDDQLLKIQESEWENDEEKDEAYDDLLDNEAISWFSYWTKLNLFEAKNTPDIFPILQEYRVMKKLFWDAEAEAEKKFSEVVEWRGFKWYVQDFKINPASKMCATEVVTSKEVMRQIKKFNQGKWIALKYLSIIFFRKENEKFEDEMIYEGSERMKLIGELPVNLAMRVGFFLSSCASTLKRILAFSPKMEIFQSQT